MRPGVNLRRTLILFLMLRMIAAPFAVRPAPIKSPSSLNIIMRVCAWPAQKPSRNDGEGFLCRTPGMLPKFTSHGMNARPESLRVSGLLGGRFARSGQDPSLTTDQRRIIDSPRC